MKKNIPLLLFLFAFIQPVLAQQVNIDSVVQIVTARNPVKITGLSANTDSLFKRLPYTKSGADRVDLIYKIFNLFANDKQNMAMGYRILAWAKAHNDQISIAVIASEMGTVLSTTGDKATGSQLETDALAAAKRSGDNQALGIVYQNSFARADYTEPQEKYYARKALGFSMAANDVRRVSWAYTDLGIHYDRHEKPDSALYFYKKSLDWSIRANSIFDICNNLYRIGYLQKDDQIKERYLQTAYKIALRTNHLAALCSSATMLAFYNNGKNNTDAALSYANKAYRTALLLAPDFRLPVAQLISKIYYKKRNIDSAIHYTTIYYTLREQLNNNESILRAQAAAFAEKQKQQQAESDKSAVKNAQQRWVLGIVIVFLLLIALIFWRNNRRSRKANALLASQKQQTELTLTELKSAQRQLIQSEKMASLGELTAGVAHEIQNPLNFVNNFSEVNREMLEELKAESKKPKAERDDALESELINDLIENEGKINHHGKRADSIVKSMLQHSRTGTGERQLTDINMLADEYLKLSYHGLRAKDKNFNATIISHFDPNLPKINVAQQDLGRVFLNLFNNAFYAVNEKATSGAPGYKPTITVTTFAPSNGGGWGAIVRDNGAGMPEAIKDKIMQPFFTTKPTGQGTGLGLSLSYDIVKGYGGQLTVNSKEGEYAEFIVELPLEG